MPVCSARPGAKVLRNLGPRPNFLTGDFLKVVWGVYFGCLDLYVWVSGLIFWVSGLIFWVSELILLGARAGRQAGGRAAGSGEFKAWGKIHFGNMYPEKLQYSIYY